MTLPPSERSECHPLGGTATSPDAGFAWETTWDSDKVYSYHFHDQKTGCSYQFTVDLRKSAAKARIRRP